MLKGLTEGYVNEERKAKFKNVCNSVFGFNSKEANLLYELYIKVFETDVYPVNKNLEYQVLYDYTSILASCVYSSWEWEYAAGLVGNTIEAKEIIINKYGLERGKVEDILTRGVQNQSLVVSNHDKNDFTLNAYDKLYDKKITPKIILDKGVDYIFKEEVNEEQKARTDKLYNQFKTKVDFAHMMATMACILYDNNEWYMSYALKVATYDLSLFEAAGYGGDIFGVGFVGGGNPRIDNSDYMADLDAVNILKRLEDNPDLIEVMTEYYTELNNGTTNRAEEFVKNIGGRQALLDLREKIREYDTFHNATSAWKFYIAL